MNSSGTSRKSHVCAEGRCITMQKSVSTVFRDEETRADLSYPGVCFAELGVAARHTLSAS